MGCADSIRATYPLGSAVATPMRDEMPILPPEKGQLSIDIDARRS